LKEAKMETEYIVMTACAKMPSNCWGRYGRVAVIEVERGARPAMISQRARGVVKIIRTWERCFDGLTDRCAFARATAEAKALAAELNAGAQRA
jgi:hypothetical protein